MVSSHGACEAAGSVLESDVILKVVMRATNLPGWQQQKAWPHGHGIWFRKALRALTVVVVVVGSPARGVVVCASIQQHQGTDQL